MNIGRASYFHSPSRPSAPWVTSWSLLLVKKEGAGELHGARARLACNSITPVEIDLQLAHLVTIELSHAGPAQRGLDQSFALAQVFEEADAYGNMLIGERQYRRQPGMQRARRNGFALIKKPEGLDINVVHRGRQEGVYAPVQGFHHLRRGPAAADLQGALGGVEHRAAFRS